MFTWQDLDWQTRAAVFLIVCGATIIGISIVYLQRIFRATPLIAERSRRYAEATLRVNRMLMLFFLAGYLVVAASILGGMLQIGVFSVSLIFLLGAVFVLLSTFLHARMVDEIQRTIEGLLPICMECKKIRVQGGNSADQEAWKEIESYISQRSRVRFSHGLCPQCLDRARSRRSPS